MTGGELITIDRYEVGQELALDKSHTDDVVNQLSDILMIKKILETKIILRSEAKDILDTKKEFHT